MGIAYRASTGTLLISDSEVDEIPALWQGKNFFETSLDGTVIHTGSTTAFSVEPTDVAIIPSSGHLLFPDDNTNKIYELSVGGDGLVGTGDDTLTSFRAAPFNARDAEGLSFGAGSLFVADGSEDEIYRLRPGLNGHFDGIPPVGDDTLSHFDTNAVGQPAPEGVEYNADNNTLYICSHATKTIAEVTLGGQLVRTLDLSGTTLKNCSGIAYAPTSNNASRQSLYVTDRGVDNDINPSENDGKLIEVTLGSSPPPPPGNSPPDVTPIANRTDYEGEPISIQVEAFDVDDDMMTFSATGLPPGVSINATTGRISGTIPAGAHTGSPYSSQVSVSDGTDDTTDNFTWTVAVPTHTGPTFTDVPTSYWAYGYIEALVSAGVTSGCASSPPRYCPEASVTRAQMAAFIILSMGEGDNVPPYQGTFSDVPEGQWYTGYVERLAELGITAGCAPGKYCPNDKVTREQMAPFLLKAIGHAYHTLPYRGVFADVGSSNIYVRYIEHLYDHGITGGCATNPLRYCPGAKVTRAEMAVFLVRTFGL
jgi:hypothetical protein